MEDHSWCKAEPLGCIVFPPLISKPGERSLHALRVVLDQFPLDCERYRARDVTNDNRIETFCNFFTRDVARAMSCFLPENKTANQIYELLKNFKILGFRQVTRAEAAMSLDLGKFVFAIAHNPQGPGHMTPCREALDDIIFVDHVGRHNARRIPINMAFGPLAGNVEFYVSIT